MSRAGAADRRSLRRRDVVRLYGVSLSTVDRMVADDRIRTRRVGRALLLCADDCEREFGWPDEAPVRPSARDLADMRELVS